MPLCQTALLFLGCFLAILPVLVLMERLLSRRIGVPNRMTGGARRSNEPPRFVEVGRHPLSSHPPSDGEIGFRFEQSAGCHGWIDLEIRVRRESASIRCSHAFPPFKEILAFVAAIERGVLPAVVTIDEEGRVARLSGRATLALEEFEFAIDNALDPSSGTAKCIVINRVSFVQAFVQCFELFLRERYRDPDWGDVDLRDLYNDYLRTRERT